MIEFISQSQWFALDGHSLVAEAFEFVLGAGQYFEGSIDRNLHDPA